MYHVLPGDVSKAGRTKLALKKIEKVPFSLKTTVGQNNHTAGDMDGPVRILQLAARALPARQGKLA